VLASSIATDCTSDVASESVGNDGYVQRHNAQMFEEGRSFSGNERDKLFMNRGDGTFADLSDLSGCDNPNDGRATIGCDFDDDGDVDLFVHELQRERHSLYRNELGTAYGGFLKVRLKATRGQWEGIGSKVIVHGPHGPVAQLFSRGAGFVSCQAPELVFGLGKLAEARVQVRWPTGELEEFGQIPAGSRAVLEQGTGIATLVAGQVRRLPDPMPPGLRVNVGASIAALALTDDAGDTVTVDLGALAGEGRLFLNLWASYCGPCIAEMGYLAQVNERSGSRLICVSVDAAAQQDKARGILNQRAPGVTGFYLVNGETGLEELLDLDRLPIPTTLIINAKGEIEGVVQGVLERGDGAWR